MLSGNNGLVASGMIPRVGQTAGTALPGLSHGAHAAQTPDAWDAVAFVSPRSYGLEVGSCANGLRFCSSPKNAVESDVNGGAFGSAGAVMGGRSSYQKRTLAKKSLRLPVVSTCSPAGPARLPEASVATMLMIFGS